MGPDSTLVEALALGLSLPHGLGLSWPHHFPGSIQSLALEEPAAADALVASSLCPLSPVEPAGSGVCRQAQLGCLSHPGLRAPGPASLWEPVALCIRATVSLPVPLSAAPAGKGASSTWASLAPGLTPTQQHRASSATERRRGQNRSSFLVSHLPAPPVGTLPQKHSRSLAVGDF